MIIALATKNSYYLYKAWRHLMQTCFDGQKAKDRRVVDLTQDNKVIDLTKDYQIIDLTSNN